MFVRLVVFVKQFLYIWAINPIIGFLGSIFWDFVALFSTVCPQEWQTKRGKVQELLLRTKTHPNNRPASKRSDEPPTAREEGAVN